MASLLLLRGRSSSSSSSTLLLKNLLLKSLRRRQRPTETPSPQHHQHLVQTRDINLGNEYYSDVFDGESPAVHVKGYDEVGHIVLGNGSVLRRPLVCYAGKVFVWEAGASSSEITTGSLSVLRAVKPKPDILVVGYGDREASRGAASTLTEGARRLLRDLNVSLELVDTKTAISTFNILQQDGRRVLAALAPLAPPPAPSTSSPS